MFSKWREIAQEIKNLLIVFEMKKIIYLTIFLLLVLGLSRTALARSGCCSHHGGVCGCGCCDGSSLSATCAPYYPSCNSKPKPDYTPLPVSPSPTSSSPTTSSPQQSSNSSSNGEGGGVFTGAIGMAVLLGGGYWVYKKIKN